MTPSEELRKRLDELGIEHDASEDDTTIFYDVDGNRYTYNVNQESGWAQLYGYNLTPERAIAATVGRRDTMELWPEWEQVLFANVSDEVAQDNLNECVHELLDKAATVSNHSCASCPEMDNPDSYISHLHRALEVADSGAGTCHNVGDKRDFCCSECGVRMFIESDDTYTMIASDERTIIKRPNFCPNCGKRVDR